MQGYTPVTFSSQRVCLVTQEVVFSESSEGAVTDILVKSTLHKTKSANNFELFNCHKSHTMLHVDTCKT